MTSVEVHKKYKLATVELLKGNLKNTIHTAMELGNELQSPTISDALINSEISYKYLLEYFIDGKPDPERNMIYNKMVATLFLVLSQLRDELLTRDSTNYEFTQKRYFPFLPQKNEEDLSKSLCRTEDTKGQQEIAGFSAERRTRVEQAFEEAVQFLFNFFWLSSDYNTNGMMGVFQKIIDDSYPEFVAKSMVVTGLTMNLWRTFDEQKILLLLDACKSSEVNTKQRALVGLCFLLVKYNKFIPYFPSIRNRLILLTDDSGVSESMQNIIIQIIATTETDKISKKLQEEIFPELMKLRPLMDKGLGSDNLLNSDEWGEVNPEWQDIIEESGASEMMQELAEMEMSGADVYMSTFSMLKSFPFFSNFSNWFLPFDAQNSHIKELFENDEKSILQSFLNSNVMCNSDRYSFCLSVLQMPEMQRNMMKSSFGDASEQMDEISKEEALYSPQTISKAVAKHYIRDLFRFFKLNNHRADFSSMFATSLLIHNTYLFDLLSANNKIQNDIAEFYFTQKLYKQALEIFLEMEKNEEPTAILYQKIGYSYQQTSQLEKALSSFKKADLIQPDDFWTIRKMALCYKLIGDNKNALMHYQQAHYLRSDNLSVRLQIIECQLELKNYSKAIELSTALQNEFPDNSKVLKTAVMSSFIGKNLSRAKYYLVLLQDENNLTADDKMIAAHLYWCLQENELAKQKYYDCLKDSQNDWVNFLILFEKHTYLLTQNNVGEKEISLLLDALQYALS